MKLDILAFGAHPDDVELGCSGSIAKAIQKGKKVGIVDLTQGELGSRGSAAIRKKEAAEASKILNLHHRENLSFRDGFFINDEAHQLDVITRIRNFCPDIVLCNAAFDRHIDHGKGSQLLNDACFLSGLQKIKTTFQGKEQAAWRPKVVLEYIQWNEITPDIIIDISGFLEVKVKAVAAYSSQFYDSDSSSANTPISSKNFLESVRYRAMNLGRLINSEAGEGFTSRQPLSIDLFDSLLR